MSDIYFKNHPANIPQLIYTLRKFAETEEYLQRICDLFEHQEERIKMLYELLYKIAPELEIIETLADTEEQEREYIEKYMNHGDYLED